MTPRLKQPLLALALAFVMVASVVAVGAVAAQTTGDDGTQAQDDADVDTQQTSFIRIVHASPDAPAVDVQVNGETVAEDVEFGNETEYVPVEAGEHEVAIVAADGADANETDDAGLDDENATDGNVTDENDTAADGNETAADGEDVVFEGTVDVEPRSVTTLAASGEVAEDAETPFSPVLLSENALEPADDEAALSVVHLSPGAPAVQVVDAENDTVVADQIDFRQATDYVTVPEGNYTLEVYPAGEGNDTEPLATANVSLDGGNAYSAYAIGYADAAADDAGLDVNDTEDDADLNDTAENETDDADLNDTEEENRTGDDAEVNDTEDENATAQVDDGADEEFRVTLIEDATWTVQLPGQEDQEPANVSSDDLVTVEDDGADLNETDDANETGLDDAENDTEDEAGLNDTDDANETDDAGLDDENDTDDADLNVTDDENETGLNESDEENDSDV